VISLTLADAGDAALVVQLPEQIDPEINGWCIALAGRLRSRLGTGIRDVVIGYCSVTVYFDPLLTDSAWLRAEVLFEAEREQDVAEYEPRAIVEVPVMYGGEHGPDLERVAAFGACSPGEVIERHSGREYRVYLLGFIPGFAYMAEVDSRIAAPRHPSPRTVVPAGSVAIAGGQTGIYPAATPGGWNIIGRTPAAPYDAGRPEPFMFRPGDRVRFHPITS
jgi:inhibitor of KinA